MRCLMFNFITARIRFIAFILMLAPMDPPSTWGTHFFMSLHSPLMNSSWGEKWARNNVFQLEIERVRVSCTYTWKHTSKRVHTHIHKDRKLPNVIFSTCTVEIQSWLLSLQHQINHCWQEEKEEEMGTKTWSSGDVEQTKEILAFNDILCCLSFKFIDSVEAFIYMHVGSKIYNTHQIPDSLRTSRSEKSR